MLGTNKCGILCALAASFVAMATTVEAADKVVRVGMIGCDTSHAPKFAKSLNGAADKNDAVDVRVVAAFPTKSDDLAASYERVDGFTKDLQKQGIEIVDSLDALLSKVDAVMIESVDGRKHWEQAQAVLAAGKPVFIDKPVAASLADAVAIFDAAEKSKVPCCTSSSLRFSPDLAAARASARAGKVTGCEAHSPCKLEPHHADLFWYGIHGVETLFSIMGPGCESVSRTQTDDFELVVGVWKDGRIGTYRGLRKGAEKYGALVFGVKDVTAYPVKDTGYEGLMEAVGEFFRTGQPAVNPAETIELFAFMEAADESKRRGGAPVKLEEVLQKARAQGPAASGRK